MADLEAAQQLADTHRQPAAPSPTAMAAASAPAPVSEVPSADEVASMDAIRARIQQVQDEEAEVEIGFQQEEQRILNLQRSTAAEMVQKAAQKEAEAAAKKAELLSVGAVWMFICGT